MYFPEAASIPRFVEYAMPLLQVFLFNIILESFIPFTISSEPSTDASSTRISSKLEYVCCNIDLMASNKYFSALKIGIITLTNGSVLMSSSASIIPIPQSLLI